MGYFDTLYNAGSPCRVGQTVSWRGVTYRVVAVREEAERQVLKIMLIPAYCYRKQVTLGGL